MAEVMEIVKEEGVEVMGGGEVESCGLEARQRRNLRCENVGGVEAALEEKKKKEVEFGEEGGRSVYFDQHQGLNSSDQNVAINSDFLDQKSLQNEETEFEAETTTVKTEIEVVKDEHKSKFQVPEFNVERVLEEQETHDLYCPDCKSCITRRVILWKSQESKYDVKHKVVHDTNADLDVTPFLPENIDDHNENKREVFGCFECFRFFTFIGLNSSDQNVAINYEFLDQKSLQNEETEFEAETATVKTEIEELVKAKHKSKFQGAEFDVERVLEEQETHDLLCPDCKSCITKRVILRKRKRTVQESKYDFKHKTVRNTNTDMDVTPFLPENIDDHNENKREVFRCLKLFSYFIPTDGGFKIFRIFGEERHGEQTTSEDQESSGRDFLTSVEEHIATTNNRG